jgi:hypothetical protein
MVPDPNEDLIRTDRSRLIQRSSRCFYFGMVGLIPLVGIVPAVLAIRLHHRVAHDTGEIWKPDLIFAAWGIALAYAFLYTWVWGLGGFLLISAFGFLLQAGAFFRVYRNPSVLAWNPARHRALLGIAMAYSGLAGLLLLGELFAGFELRDWSKF